MDKSPWEYLMRRSLEIANYFWMVNEWEQGIISSKSLVQVSHPLPTCPGPTGRMTQITSQWNMVLIELKLFKYFGNIFCLVTHLKILHVMILSWKWQKVALWNSHQISTLSNLTVTNFLLQSLHLPHLSGQILILSWIICLQKWMVPMSLIRQYPPWQGLINVILKKISTYNINSFCWMLKHPQLMVIWTGR